MGFGPGWKIGDYAKLEPQIWMANKHRTTKKQKEEWAKYYKKKRKMKPDRFKEEMAKIGIRFHGKA